MLFIIDVFIINSIVFFLSEKEQLSIVFIEYITFFWVLISLFIRFYNVYRYTHVVDLLKLLVSQFFVFFLAYFSYFTIFNKEIVIKDQIEIFVILITTISVLKFLFFYLLKKYRIGGRNYRNVVVVGKSVSTKRVIDIFNNRQDLGYRFFGFFSDEKSMTKNYLGNIKDVLTYVLQNNIDEIYCEMSSITIDQLKEIRSFSNENQIEIRLIPEIKSIYSKEYKVEYYGTIPILKTKALPFDRAETHIIKRVFDILFASVICVFLLSWFLPLFWVIIKIDSKGALFFSQKREGINGANFSCYKIRTMKQGEQQNTLHTVENDNRITRVGKFLRQTSLDELPQFFNVLKGDMSVVGPRPHMSNQSLQFGDEVKNYMKRKVVRPGITGLAQISGYRGEIKQQSDIENRVRLDIFYIENWSFFLDVKIIFQTIFNVFKGEEKAY